MSLHQFCHFFITAIVATAAIEVSAQTTEVVTREISATTGRFANPSSVWNQVWTSTDTDPIVTLTSSRNDMRIATDNKGLDLREGSANSSTYVIATEGSWHVTGFSMTFVGNDSNNPVTVTSGAHSLVSSSSEQTLTVTDLGLYDSAQFTLTGKNQGISTISFTVTLESVAPEPYIESPISMETGYFDGKSTWHNLWSTSDGTENHRVYLAAERTDGSAVLNMKEAESGSGLDLREGTSKASVFILSTEGSMKVSGYEITFVGNDADNPVTITGGGKTMVSTTEPQTFVVENVSHGSKASFQLTGNNKGITTTSFKVRLTPTSPDTRGVNVFTYNGSKPYNTVYRIPAIAYIPAGKAKGRLVAINDFRPCGADIGFGEVDLHSAISEDGGYNWTLPADLVDGDGNHVADGDGKGTPATSNHNRDCGFGDPSLVADRESGDLLLMAVCGRVPIGQATRKIPQGLATWTSTDAGLTWTPWQDITEYILTQLDDNCEYGAVDGLFFTAGRMIQSKYIKVGSHYRIYNIGGGRSASIPDTQCWVFYSDDFGKTWNILGDPYRPALTTGGAEPKCDELPDGSLVYSGRTSGGRTFNIFTYTDIEAGKGDWDQAVFGKMITGAASCNGDPLIVPVKNKTTGKKAYMMLQAIPLHPSSRVNVGVNFKILDNGYEDFGSAQAIATNWDGSYQISQIGSAYSSLTLLENGTIGILYEEATFGKDYTEVYRNLTVEAITSGAYEYCPDTDLSTALELTRQVVEGKLADAISKYSDRTELIEALKSAAAKFNESPSTETYIAFNRAHRNVVTNTSGISDIEADNNNLSTTIYDTAGRKISKPVPGMIHITSDGNKIIY